MAKRASSSVYMRRRALALIVVLLPVLIVAKACTSRTASPTPSITTTPSAAASTSAANKAVAKKATATETATATKSPTPTPTPTTVDCRNSNIAVTVTADAESYAIGSPVTLAMRITNTGSVECTRDVGALANEVYVTDADGLVVWTSDACQTQAKPQVVVIKPNRVFGNTQVWSGTNSGRDCTNAAPDATAGTYLAYARNDTVQSKAFAFTIN